MANSLKKEYFLSIKSGTDYPDLEDVIVAKSKEQAIEFFYARYSEFGRDIIRQNTYSEDEMVN